ncbi:MAG TPA: DUF4097 family beta strand repeat-containing protein [Sedimentisphaerales bacterium]|jgi:hypothetical protein|nr:DUF4097 family beta strand repeat-containing protein [Sedimentisphaerales bacterium]HNU29576.1 DUF4097 family beta strand repeat-containing protein [Sedimentisphaerales bacterium]
MRMNRLVKSCVVAGLAAVVCAGCRIGGQTFKAKFTLTRELAASSDGIGTLDVSTNVGKIHLDPAQGAEVRITAEIKVKDHTEEQAQELAEQVRIVAEPSGRTLRIRVDKPSGLKDDRLCVDFTITAPATLALKCATNVGDIRIAAFGNTVRAQTDVGAITCTGLRGTADLETNVGNIRTEYAHDAPAAITVDVSTNVGSIELTGPQDLSAKLTAETNVGTIKTDRPLTVMGPLKQSIKGSLGNGDGRISLHTNVGSIQIR